MPWRTVLDVQAPNSVHNTCVFSCFEAGDSVTNLHSAFASFRDQVKQRKGMDECIVAWNYKHLHKGSKSSFVVAMNFLVDSCRVQVVREAYQ